MLGNLEVHPGIRVVGWARGKSLPEVRASVADIVESGLAGEVRRGGGNGLESRASQSDKE